MKRLLPAAALCFVAAAPCAPAWVPLPATDGVHYLANAATLKPQDGAHSLMDIAVLAEFPKAQIAGFDTNLAYRSTVTDYRIDCANQYAWVLDVNYYASDRGQGKALRHYAFSKPARLDIVAWSAFDSIGKYACKNAGAGAAPVRLEDMKPTVIHDTRKSRYATAPN